MQKCNTNSCPTLDQISFTLHGWPDHIINELNDMIVRDWWDESSKLYQIVRNSIDLSGVFETKDLNEDDQKLLRYFNDKRHGPGLLNWVEIHWPGGLAAP